MHINAIYIKAFAGLKNYSLQFSSGANVIYGPNEKGKSTVLEFIRSMLYGLVDGTDAFQKVKPWDGSSMGGNVWFSYDGIQYELARDFGSGEGGDKFVLVNLSENKRLMEESDLEPGEFLLGIDRSLFNRSFFIEAGGLQRAAEDKTANFSEKIWQNISVLLLSGEGIGESEIYRNLNGMRDKLQARYGLEELEAEIQHLKDQMDQHKEDLLELDKLQETANQKALIKTSLDAELAQVQEKINKLEYRLVELPQEESRSEGVWARVLRFLGKQGSSGENLEKQDILSDIVLHQKELMEISRKLSTLELEVERIYTEIDAIYIKHGNKADPASLLWQTSQALKNLKQKRSDYKIELEAFTLAENLIIEKIHAYRKKFLPKFRKSAEKYMQKMSRGRYNRILMDEAFALAIEDKKTKQCFPIDRFSSGTQDQVYFSFRLALTDYLVGERKYPLFLDDILLHFDEKRSLEALNLLAKWGLHADGEVDKKQVLLFTCHKRLRKLAQDTGQWQVINMP